MVGLWQEGCGGGGGVKGVEVEVCWWRVWKWKRTERGKVDGMDEFVSIRIYIYVSWVPCRGLPLVTMAMIFFLGGLCFSSAPYPKDSDGSLLGF